MSIRKLKKLAYLVFRLTRYKIWLGGHRGKNWPESIQYTWNGPMCWTISPPVELHGHKIQVCVAIQKPSKGSSIPNHHDVYVFVDGELKHPGGYYSVANPIFFHNWSSRIAYQEFWEHGKTGPIDIADSVIAEAKRKLQLDTTDNKEQFIENNSPELRAAEAEVDALLTKARSAQRIGSSDL